MTGFVTGPVTVSVPATSANLGPGFDSLGLALGLRDHVRVEVADDATRITVAGEGEGVLALDEGHLVHRSMLAAFDRMGVAPPPGIRMHCRNVVPHARGLGSSSAAIVAGVVAARALVGDGAERLDVDGVCDLAAALEGHPDNVTPATLGGFTVAWAEHDRFHAVRLPVDPRISAVVLVPPVGVETTRARGLLPPTVSHQDAAHNAGRTALLVAALGGRTDLLLAATEDRLHQQFREPAMPQSLALVRALRERGVAAVVSGAGPSVLALVVADHEDGASDPADDAPAGWRTVALPVDTAGARVEDADPGDGVLP